MGGHGSAYHTPVNPSFLHCKTGDREKSPSYREKALRPVSCIALASSQIETGRASLTVSPLGLSFSVWKMMGGDLRGLPALLLLKGSPLLSLVCAEGKPRPWEEMFPQVGGGQARLGKPMSVTWQASWSWGGNS